VLKPDKNQTRAINGMRSTAPTFFEEFIKYLIAARDHERAETEVLPPSEVLIGQGRSRVLHEQILIFRSLGSKEEA